MDSSLFPGRRVSVAQNMTDAKRTLRAVQDISSDTRVNLAIPRLFWVCGAHLSARLMR